MEGSFGGGGDDGIGKNGGPSDGRPPNPFAGASRQFMGGAHGESPCKSALGRHDSLVAVPGALFEDKPQSANDTWRKLHSDPLLLIRQREQEALARIKNNPIKMAMIKKSVEDEKKKKQDKKEKKRHKDHHHSRSKDDKRSLRRYSDSGLSKRTTSEGLREAFSKFGQIVYARVVTDRISGFSKGFGFVRYATLEEAAEGIKGMDGKFLDGWVIFAEYARPRLPPSGPTQPQTPPPQTSEPSSGF